MDKLIAILNEMAELDDSKPTFELVNTSRVIRVDALTRTEFENPEDAFQAARELTDALLSAGYKAVNRVEIGAKTEPVSDSDEWRGHVSMCVWPTGSLTDDHLVAVGLIPDAVDTSSAK